MIQVFVDATIALPIVVHALDESGVRRRAPAAVRLGRGRTHPQLRGRWIRP